MLIFRASQFQKVADCVDFYSQKVVNIHTWPEIAAQGICALIPLKRRKDVEKKFLPGQVKSEVNRAASFHYPGEGMAACVDILIILGNHPLLDQFMHLEIDADLAVVGDKKKARDFSTIKRKISGSTYKHHGEFAADVRLTFATPLTYELPTTATHQSAVHLLIYFERLYSKWVLEEKDWKTKKINVYENIDEINWRRKKKKGGGEITSLASAKVSAAQHVSEELCDDLAATSNPIFTLPSLIAGLCDERNFHGRPGPRISAWLAGKSQPEDLRHQPH